jgi:hypothetical protein
MDRTSRAYGLLLLACLSILGLASIPAPAAGASSDEPFHVISILQDQAPRTEPTIRVLNQDDAGVLLEFELPAIEAKALDIDGSTFHVLAIEGGDFEGAVGEPMLPTYSRLIEIPDRAGVRVSAEIVETRELAGYRPIPMQPYDDTAPFMINSAAYARTGYEAADPASIGEPALARHLRVIPVTFRPLRYDPSRETIEVAGRIQVRVDYAGEDLRNARPARQIPLAPSFDKLYRELVVNYSGQRSEQITSLGTYVIICPNNSGVITALQPLVEWRTRKGYEVHLVTTAETGTTKENIKSWLQTAYNTWPNPPEYIALIGDVSGTIAIPHWNETYSGYNGETDHNYVQLAGGDILADAHIGRISVDSVDRLTLYVNKIVGYESTPYMTDTSWFGRACLTGDPSASGYTCIQIMQWHKERLLEWGYTDIDTVFSGPWVSKMTAALNLGDTVFSYRGYIGMSGFDIGNITGLTNGWKMPYAVNITCQTGSFASGTCRTESWIRAGTPPNSPTGGIASVGSATSHTDTRHNNCITYGIWRGVFWEDLYRFGESLTRGQYELFINYARMDYTPMCYFTCWNNLMGDPAGEIWTGVPQSLAVTHPGQIGLGSSAVTVNVQADGLPCEGAYVCLWKGSETFIGGYTDASGAVELPVTTPTAGAMKATVTKHDHLPYQGSIDVTQMTRFAGYLAHTIDDDTSGTSLGNADGTCNPTETIEIPVQVKNFGSELLDAVTGTLTCSDPYVTISDGSENFGTLAAGASAWSSDDFDIQLAAGAPHGHAIYLDLDVVSGADTWRSVIPLAVVSAEFAYVSRTLYDVGTTLDPGETGQLAVRIINNGGMSASSVTGTLISHSPQVTVIDAAGSFGTIAPGVPADNNGDRFTVSAEAACFPGHQAPMSIVLQFSNGMADTVDWILSVGEAGTDDPTGPDVYGYYAFDNTDTAYPDYAPTYAWIEIDPTRGGSGTTVGLTDYGDSQDDSQTIDLPFPFTYYGQSFTRATICSNGWIAMGSTYLTNYRNWNIPAAGAPDYMIAPMWDDLYQSGNNKVYHWSDTANHRYIVEWSRLYNNNCGSQEAFQIILYDPAYYPTDTGDGTILFQYDTFSNCDGQQHFCTIGIENGDQTDGIMFTYYNYYNAGAATVQAGRAIRFVPISSNPRGTLTGRVTNITDSGAPLPGAEIEVVEAEVTLISGPDGTYNGLIPAGTYTVTASHAGFAPVTYEDVHISPGQTTVRSFALTDIAAPAITGTTVIENTADTEGPYAITTTITDYSRLTERSLVYSVGSGNWIVQPLEGQGSNLWAGEIPGQPAGKSVRYYIRASDTAGNVRTDPAGAPDETYLFWVLEPVFEDEMESGAGGWSHTIVTDGFVDQWHLSTQRNHTPEGTTSWKFGDTDSGDYANSADGALVTEPIEIDQDVTLTFWHWIDAETSSYYPGYAYDGGLVEMSIDGGPWTQITPTGGYPYLVRNGSQPGPFASDTPIFSGTADWTLARFALTDIEGFVQLRFRFGSDGATTAEGWYIDDVCILGTAPDASTVQPIELMPARLALYPNLPNPFGPTGTVLRFDLPQPAPVRLEVFDAGGRLVRTLVSGNLPAGQHSIAWNGLDARNRIAGSGVYFVTLDTGGERVARRMLLVR